MHPAVPSSPAVSRAKAWDRAKALTATLIGASELTSTIPWYRTRTMRFLYGDSAPFPLGYNFLATLEAFMTAATRIVQLEADTRELARATL